MATLAMSTTEPQNVAGGHAGRLIFDRLVVEVRIGHPVVDASEDEKRGKVGDCNCAGRHSGSSLFCSLFSVHLSILFGIERFESEEKLQSPVKKLIDERLIPRECRD